MDLSNSDILIIVMFIIILILIYRVFHQIDKFEQFNKLVAHDMLVMINTLSNMADEFTSISSELEEISSFTNQLNGEITTLKSKDDIENAEKIETC